MASLGIQFIVVRSLTVQEASDLISCITVVLLINLTIFVPFEVVGPSFAYRIGSRFALSVSAFILSLIGLLPSGFFALLVTELSPSRVLVLLVLYVSLSLNFAVRLLLICGGHFQRLATGNGVGLLVSAATAGVFAIQEAPQIETILITYVSYSLGLPLFAALRYRNWTALSMKTKAKQTFETLRNADLYRLLFGNFLVTLCGRLLATGSIVFGPFFKLDSSRILEFSQIVILARLPVEFLGSTLAPLNLHIHRVGTKSGAARARLVTLYFQIFFFFTSLVIAVFFFFFGGKIYELWTGSVPATGSLGIAMTAFTLALPLSASPLRFLLTAFGGIRHLVKLSILGIAGFSVTLLVLRHRGLVVLPQFGGALAFTTTAMFLASRVRLSNSSEFESR